MNHQPFEDWLFTEEPLTIEEQSALNEHVEICKHCKSLQNAFSGVLSLIDDVQEVEPAPGFVSRWQERLAAEHQMDLVVRNRWQSMIVLILIGNVLAGLVFLLSTQFFSTFDTPISLVLSGINRLVSFVTLFNTIQNIFLTLLRTISNIVPSGLWAVLGVGLVGACAIWFISIASLSALKRRT